MERTAARLLAARLVGGLAVCEAAFCLATLLFIALGWGVGFFGLLNLVYFAYSILLLLLGIGTALAKHWDRLGLSAVLVFQAGWLAVTFPLDATAGHRQGCDFSCYAGPLEVIAIPAVLCLIAAWVVYPGWKRPAG